MEELKYSQSEMLELIQTYNNTDRKVIKANYKRILKELHIQPKDIMEELGYGKHNVHGWSTVSSPNIPMLDQALTIAIAFNFSIEEFLKEI
jgi:hypothetical protein